MSIKYWEVKEGNRELASEEYVGCVLSEREENLAYDSDWYASVWDEESQSVKEVFTGTTRAVVNVGCTIDATDEVREKANAYYEREHRKAFEKLNEEQSRIPARGRRVRVVSGRKAPIGFEGELFWLREKQFGRNKTYAIGIRNDEGEVAWTYAKNVRVIDPEQYKFAYNKNENIPNIEYAAEGVRVYNGRWFRA